jgi:glutaredoxin
MATIVCAQDNIELFGHGGCPACVKARSMLRGAGIDYRKCDLTEPTIEKEYTRRFGRGQIPVLVDGNKVVRGEKVLSAINAIKQRRAAQTNQTQNAQVSVPVIATPADVAPPVVDNAGEPDEVIPPELPVDGVSEQIQNSGAIEAEMVTPSTVLPTVETQPQQQQKGSWVDTLILGAKGLSGKDNN